ncbi:MAG: hypothetical protein J5724_05850 [Ruminococcus sp.]|nr:hypothetical protein [Ruminococcus sp.]MBP5431928.1 hypothetical protein [Ruminococcus sp.]
MLLIFFVIALAYFAITFGRLVPHTTDHYYNALISNAQAGIPYEEAISRADEQIWQNRIQAIIYGVFSVLSIGGSVLCILAIKNAGSRK